MRRARHKNFRREETTKRDKILGALFLGAFLLGLIITITYTSTGPQVALAPVVISACGTLDQPNTVYELANNVNSPGNCFTITADNITLIGTEKSIFYGTSGVAGTYYGILADNVENVKIQNVSVGTDGPLGAFNKYGINFRNVKNGTINIAYILDNNASTGSKGVYFEFTDNSRITGVTAENITTGIHIHRSNSNILKEITTINSKPHTSLGSTLGTGLSFTISNNNNATTIVSAGNGQEGIRLLRSNKNRITNVFLGSNTNSGIVLQGASNNTFGEINSYLLDPHPAPSSLIRVAVESSISSTKSQNNIFNNIYSQNDGNVILITGGINNTFNGGIIQNSQGSAIIMNDLGGASENTIKSIQVSGSAFNDLEILGNLVEKTTIENSVIEKYQISGEGIKLIKENNDGRIEFQELITGTGTQLTSLIQISPNLASVDSQANNDINKSATITLKNNPGSAFPNPTILVNGEPCPLTQCVNTTPLDDQTVIFDVAHFTEYSIGQENQPPTIALLDADQTTYTSNDVVINYLPTDDSGIASATLEINNGQLTLVDNAVENNIANQFSANLGDGDYTYEISLIDTQGLSVTSNTQSFTVDATGPPQPPTVTLQTPTNQAKLQTNDVAFNYFLDDDNGVSSTTLTIQGDTTITQIDNAPTLGTTNTFNVNLPSGNYNWQISATDVDGFIQTSENWDFTIDLPPTVTLGNPTPGQTFTSGDNIVLNYNANDDKGFSGATLILNGTSYAQNQTPVVNGQNSFTLNGLADGTYTWNVRVFDNDNPAKVGAGTPKSFIVQTPVTGGNNGIQITGFNDGINFNNIIPNSKNVSAEGNNGEGTTTYQVEISAPSSTVNLLISATNLISGSNTIPVENMKYSYSTTDPTVPSNQKYSLTETQQIVIGNTASTTVYFKFYLDVPALQPQGDYTNTVDFEVA